MVLTTGIDPLGRANERFGPQQRTVPLSKVPSLSGSESGVVRCARLGVPIRAAQHGCLRRNRTGSDRGSSRHILMNAWKISVRKLWVCGCEAMPNVGFSSSGFQRPDQRSNDDQDVAVALVDVLQIVVVVHAVVG